MKVDLDHPPFGTFLIPITVEIEDLGQGVLLTRLVRDCMSMHVYKHVCVAVNPPPLKHVAFHLETTRNFTAAE